MIIDLKGFFHILVDFFYNILSILYNLKMIFDDWIDFKDKLRTIEAHF